MKHHPRVAKAPRNCETRGKSPGLLLAFPPLEHSPNRKLGKTPSSSETPPGAALSLFPTSEPSIPSSTPNGPSPHPKVSLSLKWNPDSALAIHADSFTMGMGREQAVWRTATQPQEHGLWSSRPARHLSPPLSGCVALGQSLHLSDFQLLISHWTINTQS